MSIRSDLMYYFEQHPDKKHWRKDLAGELDLTEQQIQSAMYHVAGEPGYEILTQGQCWIYRPEKDGDAGKADAENIIIGEIIKAMPDGVQLVEWDGELWACRKVVL